MTDAADTLTRLDQLATQMQVLEAVMLALVRTHADASALLAEYDRATQRVRAVLEHHERDQALARFEQHAERVRMQIEPD